MRKLLLISGCCLLVMVVVASCCLAILAFSKRSLPHNSVSWLAKEYGVRQDKIRAVAYELGVAPEDTGSFGDGPFPMNYIKQRIDELEKVAGYVTKDDISQILPGGYELRCEPRTEVVEYYVFYSVNISPSLLEKDSALVLEFVYTRPERPEMPLALNNWRIYSDLLDSDFAVPRDDIEHFCLRKP